VPIPFKKIEQVIGVAREQKFHETFSAGLQILRFTCLNGARSSTAPEILPNVVSGCILLPSATRIVRGGGRTSDVKASLCLGNLFVSLPCSLDLLTAMGDHANASVTLRFLP
jgi:hypothetical protein